MVLDQQTEDRWIDRGVRIWRSLLKIIPYILVFVGALVLLQVLLPTSSETHYYIAFGILALAIFSRLTK